MSPVVQSRSSVQWSSPVNRYTPRGKQKENGIVLLPGHVFRFYFMKMTIDFLLLNIMVQDVKHVTEHFIHICRSTEQRISVVVLFVYKMLLQLVAFILAIRTQRIKIKGLNEAKFIIAAVYASSLGLVLATLTHFILVEYENVHAVLFAVALGFSGTAILGLLFIPKVIIHAHGYK